MERLNAWCVPAEVRDDPELLRRAQLLVLCVGVLVVVYPVMALVYGLRCHPAVGFGIGLLWLAVPLPLVVMKRTKSPVLAGHAVCALLWTTFTFAAALTGGTHAPIFADYLLVPVLAVLFVGERGGKIWAAITALSVVVTALRTTFGIGVKDWLSPEAVVEFRTAEMFAAGGVLVVVTLLHERVKNRALDDAEAERARATEAHERATLLLDLTGQGFITLDRGCRVLGEVSATAKTWLPSLGTGESFAAAVSQADASVGAMFDLCWDELVDGFLPLEVNLAQMPDRLTLGNRVVSLAYCPLTTEDGEVQRVVVTLTDITSELARERAEDAQRELLVVFRHILSDRAAVVRFIEDTEQIVARLCTTDTEFGDALRALHTLKGNAGLFGLKRFAATCHALEDRMVTADRPLGERERMTLGEAWQAVESPIRPLLGSLGKDDIVLTREVHENFVSRMSTGEARERLVREARLWAFESLDARLGRFGAQAVALGRRLGKGEIDVRVDAANMRCRSRDLEDFWTVFVHVVRNAVDHGFAPMAERQNERATLELSARTDDVTGCFIVEVSDDGRGIDWNALAARAASRGLPHESKEALVDALFADGVSSACEVTHVSGRGVGLAAVKRACDNLGGVIDVQSERGHGTRFTFRFPQSRVAVGTLRRVA